MIFKSTRIRALPIVYSKLCRLLLFVLLFFINSAFPRFCINLFSVFPRFCVNFCFLSFPGIVLISVFCLSQGLPHPTGYSLWALSMALSSTRGCGRNVTTSPSDTMNISVLALSGKIFKFHVSDKLTYVNQKRMMQGRTILFESGGMYMQHVKS